MVLFEEPVFLSVCVLQLSCTLDNSNSSSHLFSLEELISVYTELDVSERNG